MTSAEFWDLTLYDVGGWVGRIQRLQEQRKEQLELHVELQRHWMAFYGNFKIDLKKYPALEPSDFLRLTDEPEPEIVKESHDELMKKMSQVRRRKKKK